jgi:hypothetical protein
VERASPRRTHSSRRQPEPSGSVVSVSTTRR